MKYKAETELDRIRRLDRPTDTDIRWLIACCDGLLTIIKAQATDEQAIVAMFTTRQAWRNKQLHPEEEKPDGNAKDSPVQKAEGDEGAYPDG